MNTGIELLLYLVVEREEREEGRERAGEIVLTVMYHGRRF